MSKSASQRSRPGIEVRRETAAVLATVQPPICSYCGRRFPPLGAVASNDPQARSVGHVRPACAGGQYVLGNLTLEHRRCNEERGSDMPNGCTLIFLSLVNERLGIWEQPDVRSTRAQRPP